jgi:hypothetical protein
VIALVSAFVAQGLLIRMREPSMPGEEIACVMDLIEWSVIAMGTPGGDVHREGLLDMSRHEIIVAVFTARTVRLGSLWWKFCKALHCRDIVILL